MKKKDPGIVVRQGGKFNVEEGNQTGTYFSHGKTNEDDGGEGPKSKRPDRVATKRVLRRTSPRAWPE